LPGQRALPVIMIFFMLFPLRHFFGL
jgi:hypothetical protein